MNILFVCTGNTCRSPMAEAILKHYIKQNKIPNISVTSAGISVDENFSKTEEKAVVAIQKLGISIRTKKAKALTESMLNSNDYVITMTKNQKDLLNAKNVYTLSELSGCSDIIDPFNKGQDIYDITALKIQLAIDCMMKNILKR